MRKTKRAFALFLSLCMICTLIPIAAVSVTAEGTVIHDPSCTYAAEIPCAHTHDDVCGYIEATVGTPCTHPHPCNDDNCLVQDENACNCGSTSPGLHSADCGVYSSPFVCSHEHDAACGYTAAVKGVPCSHTTHDAKCGYTPESPCNCHGHIHSTSGGYTHDAEAHYKTCDIYVNGQPCGNVYIAPHSMANGVCTVCGYGAHVHEWSSDWSGDENGHWHACTDADCKLKNDYTGHSVVDNTCTVCGYNIFTVRMYYSDSEYVTWLFATKETTVFLDYKELSILLILGCNEIEDAIEDANDDNPCIKNREITIRGFSFTPDNDTPDVAAYSYGMLKDDEYFMILTRFAPVCTLYGHYDTQITYSHTYDDIVDAKYLASAAACTEKAAYYRSCTVCGERDMANTFEHGNPLGHDFITGEYDGYDETHHWRSCNRDGCNETDAKAAHSGGTATETLCAVCAVCGQPYGGTTPDTGENTDVVGTVQDLDRSFEQLFIEIATVSGAQSEITFTPAYGESLPQETQLNATPLSAAEVGEMLKHKNANYNNVRGTFYVDDSTQNLTFSTDDGKKLYARFVAAVDLSLSNNGNKIQAAGTVHISVSTIGSQFQGLSALHINPDGTIDQGQSEADDKQIKSTFSVKGMSPFIVLALTEVESEQVNSPQTGDNSNIPLWIALLFVSGGAAVALTVYGRKRRANR